MLGAFLAIVSLAFVFALKLGNSGLSFVSDTDCSSERLLNGLHAQFTSGVAF